MADRKYVYFFGGGKADGRADMKDLLGGKGANLAEMANMGLPVPAGFTIVTDYCNVYLQQGRKFGPDVKDPGGEAMRKVEQVMGMKYGDADNPLLLSCRSGARQSMPGMMETVLNVGLCSKTIPGLIKRSNNERFVYDAYRRLLTMYSDVVMEKAEDIEPAEGNGIRPQLERIMHALKEKKGCHQDTDLTTDDLKYLCDEYKKKVREVLGREFPDDPQEQLWGAIGAVFKSWHGRRAIAYRKIEGIPHEWGTACTVQSMVFGNLGSTSATGVAFTRNPATGENKFYGEWLVNAQGEDVVAGIRTPQEISEAARKEAGSDKPSMEQTIPKAYAELKRIYNLLERRYRDMQDLEFTVEQGKLWMLQTRNGKRTAKAALRIAVELANEGLISKNEAVLRIDPLALDQLLHPTIDPRAHRKVIATGLPASPGAASGEIVFSSDEAATLKADGKKLILVRVETSPEDIHGMHAAEGILTPRGGMTSHAAVVARGMGKPCVSGAGTIRVNYAKATMTAGGLTFNRGDLLTIDGATGEVIKGAVTMRQPELSDEYTILMEWADAVRRMGVRANADTPRDARVAQKFGAEGIGLCRT
ncbi:MAG: pyruvate, phosphate dikinase, partial [Gemmataceae bacterium]